MSLFPTRPDKSWCPFKQIVCMCVISADDLLRREEVVRRGPLIGRTYTLRSTPQCLLLFDIQLRCQSSHLLLENDERFWDSRRRFLVGAAFSSDRRPLRTRYVEPIGSATITNVKPCGNKTEVEMTRLGSTCSKIKIFLKHPNQHSDRLRSPEQEQGNGKNI